VLRFWLLVFEHSQLLSFIIFNRFDTLSDTICPKELAARGAIFNPVSPRAYPEGGIEVVRLRFSSIQHLKYFAN